MDIFETHATDQVVGPIPCMDLLGTFIILPEMPS
jgi:hypothetical protein